VRRQTEGVVKRGMCGSKKTLGPGVGLTKLTGASNESTVFNRPQTKKLRAYRMDSSPAKSEGEGGSDIKPFKWKNQRHKGTGPGWEAEGESGGVRQPWSTLT